MRATEFITEAQFTAKDYSQAMDVIMRDCQPLVSQIDFKTAPLWRGVHPNSLGKPVCPGLTRDTVQLNRRPTNSDPQISAVADDFFLKQFGIRYRTNSVFTTGITRMAADYGEPYILLPIGNFSFCWSPSVDDFYTSYDQERGTIQWDTSKYPKSPKLKPKPLLQWMRMMRYKQNIDLKAAIKSGNEIMIHCKDYYLLNPNILNNQ